MLRSLSMHLLVIALLIGLWAWILLPGLFGARREASPLNSIDAFERSMVLLAPGWQHPDDPEYAAALLAHHRRRARVVRRRRELLARLVAAVSVALVMALVAGGVAWALLALACAALGGYILLLLQVQAREDEARRKVRRLPPRAPEVRTVQVKRWTA